MLLNANVTFCTAKALERMPETLVGNGRELHSLLAETSPCVRLSPPPQMENLRLAYGTIGSYHTANGIHASEPVLDCRRRNSAVEVIFAAELERSKPEADPTQLHHSQSSSAFPLVYTELERDWEPADLYGQRLPLTSFQPSYKLAGNSRHASVDSAGEVSPRPLAYTDVPFAAPVPPHVEMVSPQVFFYVDRPPQFSRHLSVDPTADRIRGIPLPGMVPTKPSRSPATPRLRVFEPEVLPRPSYLSSASMEQEEDGSCAFAYDLQEPKRSWSQSDMKAARFPYGSEFHPLGPCPVLSSRKADILQYVLTQQRFPEPSRAPRPPDLYVGSGTESSDSDSDLLPEYYSLYGRVVKAPRARVRLSSGSLQLEEEDEEVCLATSSSEGRTSLGPASKYFT